MISATIDAIFRVSLPLNPSNRSQTDFLGQSRTDRSELVLDGQFPDGPTYPIKKMLVLIVKKKNRLIKKNFESKNLVKKRTFINKMTLVSKKKRTLKIIKKMELAKKLEL